MQYRCSHDALEPNVILVYIGLQGLEVNLDPLYPIYKLTTEAQGELRSLQSLVELFYQKDARLHAVQRHS